MANKVSIEEICSILAGEGREPFTKITITRFVQDGMPKASRGSYDPIACLRWYVGRLRDSAKKKQTESSDGSILTLDKEQIRLTAAKADNEEMTAAERRNTLLPIEIYRAEQAKMAQIVKLKFLNMPSRLAPKLESLTRNEIKALMTSAVKEVLTELARGSHVDDAPDEPPSAPAKRKRTPSRSRSKPRARKR